MWDMLLPVVLRMSFKGSIVILVVLFVRILLRKAPKIFSYLLWAVVLLRLLCPVSFSTQISVMQFVNVPERAEEQIKYQVNEFKNSQNTLSVQAQTSHTSTKKAVTDIKLNKKVKTLTRLHIATVVWISGTLAILIYSFISLILFYKKLIGAVQLRDNIYLTDYISSAFVFGLFRPKIYLPSMLSEREQEYIIMHEQIHIQRKDYLIKILALITLAIHWFNPFVWLAFRLSEKDMEMSCDEAVIKKISHDIRAEYSASLLKLAADKRSLSGTLSAFGESEAGSRIKNVLRYKKPTIAVILAASAIIVTTIVFAGSEPKRHNKNIPQISSTLHTNSPAPKATSYNRASYAEGSTIWNKYANSVSAMKIPEGQLWMQAAGINNNFEHTMECGFLRSMTNDTIEVDPVEFIDEDTDSKRRKELGITLKYLHEMDGYALNNPDTSTLTWNIDENTEFIFIDWGRDFIKGEVTNSIQIKTKDKDLFYCYLTTYENSKPGMPFFFEVENGLVKRLVERFFA